MQTSSGWRADLAAATMRVVLDLQACQSASRLRGIGRYSGSLAASLIDVLPEGALRIMLDRSRPQAAAEVELSLWQRTGRRPNLVRRPTLVEQRSAEASTARDGFPRALDAAWLAGTGADVVHTSSLFEGFVEDLDVADPTGIPGTLAAVTVYDLIPLVMPGHYLSDPRYARWYRARIDRLRRYDLFLAISEGTRRDLVDRLGIDDDLIHVIGAGVDDRFRVLEADSPLRTETPRRWGIESGFILYTGNDDPRKNTGALLEAYGRLPESLRRRHQLVLNQVGDPRSVRREAERLGVATGELVITGHVSDDDLVALLNTCALFVFPSLYEGFGLPVLEAMRCGAPVIAADASSIPEVLARADARFDPNSIDSMTQAIVNALSDRAFRADLSEYGLSRSKAFTWERVARACDEAYAKSLDRRDGHSQRHFAAKGRRPVALVTPLPPERTGIADYVSELLPELATKFDLVVYTTAPLEEVVVPATVDVRSVERFETEVQQFDHVIYQFGNSPFHSHMVALLRRYPGVVVLHDVNLTSMFWHMDRAEGQPGTLVEALVYSHGHAAAVEACRSFAAESVRNRCLASREVLESATAMIVHSQFAGEMLTRSFQGCSFPPIRVVPLHRKVERRLSEGEKSGVRARHGIAQSSFLICSFGFIAETKCAIELVEAFAAIRADGDSDAVLVFVGANDGGTYGEELLASIRTHGQQSNVVVTGFASADQYRDFLSMADVAVQLRRMSRGESSATVLDCLAHGIPTIVNDHGSSAEYPASVVEMLSSEVRGADLAVSLSRLRRDVRRRAELARKGREFLVSTRSPSLTAQCYRSIVGNAVARQGVRALDRLVSVAATAAEGQCVEQALRSATAIKRALVTDSPRRLIVDLSEVVTVDYRTGIHRVVRNVTRALLQIGDTVRVVPAYLDRSIYREANTYIRDDLQMPIDRLDVPIRFGSGDVLLMLDSAWSEPARFTQVFQSLEAAGGEVVGVLYDMIPIRYPKMCADGMPESFEHWLRHLLRFASAVVGISRATVADLQRWIDDMGVPTRARQRLGHFHLAADMESGFEQTALPDSPELAAFLDSPVPFFLSVGTVEPRKGVGTTLEAFNALWASGGRARWLLIGKQGWNVEDLAARLVERQDGTTFLWLKSASDKDLASAYARCRALIQASVAEGFGLPIVEAARFGRPTLATRIGVFEEVAGERADYFDVGDSAGLVRLIEEHTRAPKSVAADTSSTWDASAKSLLRELGLARRTAQNREFSGPDEDSSSGQFRAAGGSNATAPPWIAS